MPGGKGNIKPEDNTGGFQTNPSNINRKGQPVSIKNQLKEILLKDGELPISADQFLRMQKKDGKEYYIFKIPTQMAMAMRLSSMAMGKNNNAFQALKLIQEMFDGRAKQETDINLLNAVNVEVMDQETADEIAKLDEND